MIIHTQTRSYFIRSVRDGIVLYDIDYNPAADHTPLDNKEREIVGVPLATNRNIKQFQTRPLTSFTLDLAAQGIYFKPGHDVLIQNNYGVQ